MPTNDQPKQFRILVQGDEDEQAFKAYPKWPLTVPWSLVEPHAEQAMRNHDQSLETLNRRGGLAPQELWAVLNDAHWKVYVEASTVSCMAAILARLEDFNAR